MGSLDKKFKIGIVSGEQSGDQLGASLIQKIKEIEPSVEFVGVGGPQMIKEGLNSYYDSVSECYHHYTNNGATWRGLG